MLVCFIQKISIFEELINYTSRQSANLSWDMGSTIYESHGKKLGPVYALSDNIRITWPHFQAGFATDLDGGGSVLYHLIASVVIQFMPVRMFG